MVMTVNRFEPQVCERMLKFTVENKGVVVIKDHSTDKIVAMVNLDTDSNKNMELAGKVIEAIEEYLADPNEN